MPANTAARPPAGACGHEKLRMAQRPTGNVEIDEAFHYPPELLELLVEAIALLFRSKESVILFFRGAGLKGGAIEGWERRVRGDRESVRKVGITRDLLAKVNAMGDGGIRLRREILKRVYETEDFSACWPEQEDRARVLVTRVRQIRDRRYAGPVEARLSLGDFSRKRHLLNSLG